MKIRCFIFYIILFLSLDLFSQENQKYFEDQFYLGLAYNSLGAKVEDFKENKFSYSLNYGFIKDIPVTKNGKIALGLGLGFSHNSLNNNLKFKNPGFEFQQNVGSININRYNYTEFQIPFEIRWRNSSLDNYKFWRIYSGFKLKKNFTLYSNPAYGSDLKIKDIEDWTSSIYLNAGYNTWNISLEYDLKPLIQNKKTTEDTDLSISFFRVGLIFYFL